MLFRVVSDHFSSVFLVADCLYLLPSCFCQMFLFRSRRRSSFLTLNSVVLALFYVVFGGL